MPAAPTRHPHLLTEAELQACVIDAAEKLGWRVVHFADSRREVAPDVLVGDKGAKDWPDLVLLHPERGALFRELKAYDARGRLGQVTDGQAQMLALLVKCGFDAALWTPECWFDGTVDRALGVR